MDWASDLPPRDASPLFRPLLRELVLLLRSLEAEDWERPTLAGIHRLDVRGSWDLALPILNARSVIV